MTGWDRDYLENKEDYLALFDSAMGKEQERNIEFLEKSLKDITGRKFAVACSSGTDALLFALIGLDLKSDDEVLVTNFSWISSASCVSLAGAVPVFCDVDLDTYHMSLDSIKRMVSDKTMRTNILVKSFIMEISFLQFGLKLYKSYPAQ